MTSGIKAAFVDLLMLGSSVCGGLSAGSFAESREDCGTRRLRTNR